MNKEKGQKAYTPIEVMIIIYLDQEDFCTSPDLHILTLNGQSSVNSQSHPGKRACRSQRP